MTKNELISLTNDVRGEVEKLRAEMAVAVDSASETDGDVIPHEEECDCRTAFNTLIDTLSDFAFRLAEVKDLPEGTLVMCKAHESHLEGWRVQYYLEKGQTTMGSPVTHGDWLYIVPLKYFKPTATDWRPEDKCNWANFGEEE